MDREAVKAPLAPVDRYVSQEVAELERERLWPKVWLMACRLEQVEKPGDYVVFDIDRETILVLRTASGQLKAFYNVCQHRGRRLKEGCGNTGKSLRCPFHGWSWSTEGALEHVVWREDWDTVPELLEDKNLPELRLDTWSGWVFVSMDPDIEPLLDYLAPAPEYLGPFDLQDCGIDWHVTIRFPCNWKTVVNAFNENYHTRTTHPQLNKFGLPKLPSVPLGRHSHFRVDPSAGVSAAQNLGTAQQFKDLIETIVSREEERWKWLASLSSRHSVNAARGLRDAVSPDSAPDTILKTFRELHRQNIEAAGARWPEKLTPEIIERAGIDWHLFPNFLFLLSLDGALVYRARPDPKDAEACWLDIWSLQRSDPDNRPAWEHRVFNSLAEAKGVNPFLEQDFANLVAVQRGMWSRGFKGAAYNPVQEGQITNFERNLDEHLGKTP